MRLKRVLIELMKIRLWFLVKGNCRLLVYRKANVIVSEGAQIKIGTVFRFNRKWTSFDPFPSLLVLGKRARLIVLKDFSIFSGSRVYINEGAVLELGSGYINNNANIACFERIQIGHGVAISDNVTIRDSDNHTILSSTHAMTQPIVIGNHVWIGMNVTILKGVCIGDGCIIAAGSVVSRSIPSGCLAGGVPARVLKEGVQWE